MPKDEHTTTDEKIVTIQFPGSLRDWFAGQALAGYAAGNLKVPFIKGLDVDEAFAGCCYVMADAMLRERTRQENDDGAE